MTNPIHVDAQALALPPVEARAGEIRNDAENGENLSLQPTESEGDEKDIDSIDVNAQDPPLPPGEARSGKIRNDTESGEDLPLQPTESEGDEKDEDSIDVNAQDPPVPPGEARSGKIRNDAESGEDLLDVNTQAGALADTTAFKDLEPPFVVGILGGWGSGKTFAFNLISERLAEIQSHDVSATNDEQIDYVGHIFLVKFDAWTYAKGDLWSSLMYQILIDLNAQLDLQKAFVATVVGSGSWVCSRFADGIKRVKKLTEDIDHVRQLEGDIESGRSDKMTKLKYDINVLEKRLWVKKGESTGSIRGAMPISLE